MDGPVFAVFGGVWVFAPGVCGVCRRTTTLGKSLGKQRMFPKTQAA